MEDIMSNVSRIPTRTAPRDGWLRAEERPLDAGGPPGPFPPLPAGFTDMPAFAHFAAWAERQPDRMAIEDGTLRLSYGDLLRAATNLAKGVVATTPPGACVALLLPNSALYPLAALACLAAGRPYVALDAHQPAAYNTRLAEAAGAVAVVTQNLGVGPLPALPDGARRINVNLAFAEEGAH